MRWIAVPLVILLAISVIPLGLGETPWLEDYSYRKLITIAGSAGAGTGYVVFVKAYYADGTDGFEVLTGGHNGINATKIYLDGKVEADFDDVRFTETDGETELDYFRDTYTASTSALFAVEVTEDLDSNQSFYIYFGDAGQETESDAAATFRRVISSGIALALPMNEAAGADVYDYSGNGNDGVATGTTITTGKYVASRDIVNGDFIEVADDATISLTAAATICSWIKPHAQADGLHYPLSKLDGGMSKGWGLWRYGGVDNRIGFLINGIDDIDKYVISVATLADDNWGFVAGRYSDAGNSISVTVGTTHETEACAQSLVDSDTVAWMGKFFGFTWDGLMEGLFIFNSSLSDAVLADLAAYYPQCSSANLGSLYLRSFVNPEPQPSTIDSLEVNNRYASTNYVWMAVLLVIGFVFMGFMFLRRGN